MLEQLRWKVQPGLGISMEQIYFSQRFPCNVIFLKKHPSSNSISTQIRKGSNRAIKSDKTPVFISSAFDPREKFGLLCAKTKKSLTSNEANQLRAIRESCSMYTYTHTYTNKGSHVLITTFHQPITYFLRGDLSHLSPQHRTTLFHSLSLSRCTLTENTISWEDGSRKWVAALHPSRIDPDGKHNGLVGNTRCWTARN